MSMQFEGEIYDSEHPNIRAHHLVQIYNSINYLKEAGYAVSDQGILDSTGNNIDETNVEDVLNILMTRGRLYREKMKKDLYKEQEWIDNLSLESSLLDRRKAYFSYVRNTQGFDLMGLRNVLFTIVNFEKEQFNQFKELDISSEKWNNLKNKLFSDERVETLYNFYFQSFLTDYNILTMQEFDTLLGNENTLKEVKLAVSSDPLFGKHYYRDHYEPNPEDKDYKLSFEDSLRAEAEVLFNWLNSSPDTIAKVTVRDCDFCNARVYGLSCAVQESKEKRVLSRDSISMARFVFALQKMDTSGIIPRRVNVGEDVRSEIIIDNKIYNVRLENVKNSTESYKPATTVQIPMGLLRYMILNEEFPF